MIVARSHSYNSFSVSWHVQYSILYKYVNLFILKKGFLGYSKVWAVRAFNQSMDYEPKTDTGVEKLVLTCSAAWDALWAECCAPQWALCAPTAASIRSWWLLSEHVWGGHVFIPSILKGHSDEMDFLKVYIDIIKSIFTVCALMFCWNILYCNR